MSSARRFLTALAIFLCVSIGPYASPSPVHAEWPADITVTFDPQSTGTATVVSDDELINCRIDLGVVSGDCSQHYLFADFLSSVEVTLTATPAPGSEFCSAFCTTAPQQATVTLAKGGPASNYRGKVNRLWYTVQGRHSGPGMVSETAAFECAPTGLNDWCYTYRLGDTADLLGIPNPGWNFAMWEGAPCDSAPRQAACRFTITGNVSGLFAWFGYWKLSLSSQGEGHLCLYGDGADECYAPGASKTQFWTAKLTYRITAVPETGSRFDHWNTGGPCTGQGAACSFALNSDVTVKAFFATGAAPTPRPTQQPAATPGRSTAPGSTAPGSTAPASTEGASAAPSGSAQASELPGATTAPAGSSPAGGTASPSMTDSPAPGTASPTDPASGGAPGGLDLTILALIAGLGLVLVIGFAVGRRTARGRGGATPPRA